MSSQQNLAPAGGSSRQPNLTLTGQTDVAGDARPSGILGQVRLRESVHEPARVLIADDEHAARYGLVRALSNQGYALREAGNGEEAYAVLETFQPDVVLSDINMPGMNGLALLRRVQELGETAPLVVLITAYGSESVAVEALRAGAHDYLAKPFELDDLRKVIRQAVEKRRLLRENRAYYRQLSSTVEELKRSQVALVQAEKMASLSKLVAGIAHEINNPLGALTSNLDLIERTIARWREGALDPGTLAGKLAQTASQSRVACARIAAIVTNLVQFAQLDRAEWQRFSLVEAIETTLARFRAQLAAGIDIDVEWADLPEIEGCPRDLNQVFMHLLTNAQEAIQAAGRAGVIRVRGWREPEAVTLEIEDNGCGIDPEDIPRLFDPGFTTKGAGVGTGLGLAISLQIVRAHGGMLEASSRLGVGARFAVRLPVARKG